MASEVDQVFDSRAGLPAAIGVALAAFFLFGLMWTPVGLAVLVASIAYAWVVSKPLAQDLILIGIGLCAVATTSVRVAGTFSWTVAVPPMMGSVPTASELPRT